MAAGKRKLEHFDPNKSDSDDTDYVSQPERPRKVSRKSHKKGSKTSSQPKRRRTKYGGSDVEDDEEDDSLLEDSFSEDEEEEIEMDPVTGRGKRKAAKKGVNYEEPDDSEDLDESQDSSDDEDEQDNRAKRSRVVKLKLPTGTTPQTIRTTRAGSAARSRGGTSREPTSATRTSRRNTRAHTEEGEEPIALSNSGRHVIRESRSPEPIGRARASRGSKGVKQPAVIKEELHESSSFDQQEPQDPQEADVTMAIEVAEVEENEEEPATGEIVTQVINVDDDGDEDDQISKKQQPSEPAAIVEEEDDDDDDIPITRGRTRGSRASLSEAVPAEDPVATEEGATTRRLTRRSAARKATGQEQSSDFEPAEESGEDELTGSDTSPKKGAGRSNEDDTDSQAQRGRRATQGKSKSTRSSRRRPGSDDDEELDADELMEEAEELRAGRRRRPVARDPDIVYEQPKRQRKPVDYRIKPMDQIYAADEDAEDVVATPSRRAKGGRGGASQPWERNLYTTYGPFGGAGGPAPVIGGPWGTGAAGGADSDSSDDENMARPHVAGNIGMTPTTNMPSGLLPGLGQTNPSDPMAAMGTPANLGKVKSQKALADADPLGVDENVDFSKVGGLAGHIDQLKEMVQMPLLYPELFMKFHVVPPRGVLFHGPPGTGKTLLARALAASVGSGGRKITFYMRKGADALSKWVGEAERQLRLLFEEARKTQPSIIFFDEIDGLAPVRSSKQEQIHASIVSTLLALMDGMDGRGQVIVIGATNRPDNIDPALRRPGRFDREFYFPLPDIEGRLSIINIHTKDWGVDDAFKNSLARITKGYGGADLRALCTEAALNAIQRTYPQIYSSNDKLIVDADKIKITAKDFILSIKKMIPSSERATSSGAAPLPKVVEPLLRVQLKEVQEILDGLIPLKKKTTALQEALYEQYNDADLGFGREILQQEFEKSRVFRPRLLIEGLPGMGQGYLGSALLNHFEGLHVQNFDLPTIYSDSARSAETAIVQLFAEVKRHKPSVIFLPGIDTWYHTLSPAVITTFLGLLRAIPPTDAVLVLGIADTEPAKASHAMLRDLFGFSKKNRFQIQRPSQANREEFFKNILAYVRKAPRDFPDPANRKLRKLDTLEIAPPPPPRVPTKEEIKALKKRDHQTLNTLKVLIQPIMDQIQKKYRKFRNPVLPQSMIQYLFDEQDPNFVRSNIASFRPFELEKNKDGVMGLRETASSKFFYNLETTTIEERLSNGFYARPKDFLADIRTLSKDAKHIGDKERLLKANEMLSNVEVDIAGVELNPALADCENVYQRQLERAKAKVEKERKRAAQEAGLGLESLVRSDVPVRDHDYGAPMTLGVRPTSFVTPFTTPSSLSNGHAAGSSNTGDTDGHHHMSNGSSGPSRVTEEDVHMIGTDGAYDSHFQHAEFTSQGMPPPVSQWSKISRGPSNLSSYPTGPNTQVSQVSQYSGFQQLPHNLSPSALVNDASTTTSGKKTTDPSSENTQRTNGHEFSEFFSPLEFGNITGDSQLTDTQRLAQLNSQAASQDAGAGGSQEPWIHPQHKQPRNQLPPNDVSQTSSFSSQDSHPPIPLFAEAPRAKSYSKPSNASIDAILNPEPVSSQAPSDKDMIVDEAKLSILLESFVRKSSGCSIEQLEQINRELMDTLWKMRGEYNRDKVGMELKKVFNEVISDINEMQKILQASQEEEEEALYHS